VRARNLKPGFFDNEELAEGGPSAQVLFEGLWCLADREGILENRPLRIKAKIFPYYDPKDYGGRDIHELLNFLAAKKFIRFYSANGHNLISIDNFKKHQSPHSTEKASTFPPPPHEEITVNPPLINSEPTEDHESTCVEIVLNPDSPKPVSPREASASVAEPAAPSGDAPPTEAEAAVSVVDEGGNGASPPKPKFGPATLVELWNGLGCKPTVSELTDERRKKAGLRLRKRGDPDWWRMLFEKARDLNKPFLNFDFLMRSDTNCLKVLEGNYDHDFGSRGDARGARSASPQQRTPRGYDKRKDLYIVEVPDPS
jgi:hypothetical protein